MDLKEMGWDVMDWIKLAGGRDRWRSVSKKVRNVWFLYSSGKFFASWGNVNFPRRTLLLEVNTYVRESSFVRS
jgi:hypothetical protein